jgi:hypothetical protein
MYATRLKSGETRATKQAEFTIHPLFGYLSVCTLSCCCVHRLPSGIRYARANDQSLNELFKLAHRGYTGVSATGNVSKGVVKGPFECYGNLSLTRSWHRKCQKK